MPKEHKPSKPSRDQGPSRHKGSEHHGWSPDVDETRQQENPSARRSFRAQDAPPPGPGRKTSKEERTSVPGDRAESGTTRGEEYGEKSEKGMRDTGRKGRSGRPSGTKDDTAFTGVDPNDTETGPRQG
ncbi:hypothetical protein ACGF5F_15525 [Streptomyces sp. NPDC047821]|uniref:hypothetical protein n=1 Tax=Streptomyces sp. NPDC047821 TaxID=3365488 RepID=UPI00371170A4